jgi:hypothetical protein
MPRDLAGIDVTLASHLEPLGSRSSFHARRPHKPCPVSWCLCWPLELPWSHTRVETPSQQLIRGAIAAGPSTAEPEALCQQWAITVVPNWQEAFAACLAGIAW